MYSLKNILSNDISSLVLQLFTQSMFVANRLCTLKNREPVFLNPFMRNVKWPNIL